MYSVLEAHCGIRSLDSYGSTSRYTARHMAVRHRMEHVRLSICFTERFSVMYCTIEWRFTIVTTEYSATKNHATANTYRCASKTQAHEVCGIDSSVELPGTAIASCLTMTVGDLLRVRSAACCMLLQAANLSHFLGYVKN